MESLEKVFSIKNSTDKKYKIITIFGIKFKLKSKKLMKKQGLECNSFLENIFSIKNSINKSHKIITIIGIKFKIKTNKNSDTKQYEWQKFPDANPIKTGRIAFIIEDSIPQCKLYRVTNKLNALKQLGYVIDIVSWRNNLPSLLALQTAEFVIFYRVPFFDNVKKYYEEAERLGIKKIFDIDDLIFDYDLYYQYVINQKISDDVKKSILDGTELYLESLKNADEVWVSTETLAEISKTYNKNVKIVPNCIPKEMFEISPQKTKNKIKIFYGSGSDTHNTDFQNCFYALEEILNKYEDVELYVHGLLDTNIFSKNIQNKIHKIDLIDARDYYFAIANYDIALAPLEKSVFSDAKSNIKFIEAAMLEIPIVASPANEFKSIIQNGVTGFLAQSKDDWIQALSFLIENKEAREKIGKNAKEKVLSEYGKEANYNYIKNAIDTLDVNSIPNQKKVLFVNVLYGYSSFGGATIVAEKLAEAFNKYEQWESYVFSCHLDSEENILVRYNWNNVPVFSSSIYGVNLEYENTRILENFEKVLNVVKPDIVHFHCIQSIGVDVISLVQKYEIPYTITMHDAWFACPRQFMLDKEQKFCNQTCADAEICNNRCDISHKDFYKRKHKIYDLIKKANCIYSPTSVFNKQIEQNFPNIKFEVNSNGIDFEPQHTNKNNKEKIVFGFFGGKEAVKGYFFIKEILNHYNSNWEIILIDTASKFGIKSINNSEWNNNAIILDYVKHEDMYKIFQQIDVLLFPSEWNESFGLTVREAIANDVFVICSDCGGPTAAIAHGENGLIFKKRNKQEFIKCLDYVFANKEKIKNYHTTNYGDIRTYEEQASELRNKFEEIINNKKIYIKSNAFDDKES